MEKELKIFVVEEHTEALEVLSLAARRKLINIGDCSVIHLDSHPDLSCFEDIGPEHIKDRNELCHRLRNAEDGISSFILPAIAMGLVSKIVWVKPPWTDQIPVGEHYLTFGWKGEGGNAKMRMATDLSYWADDGSAVSTDIELSGKVQFYLNVCEIADWDSEGSTGHNWVLDICLDYFSCANPLHEPDLPEHESSAEEISAMLDVLHRTLKCHKDRTQQSPRLCIIARSEQDGFTPTAVAANLESSVIDVIGSVYGSTKTIVIESFEQFYDPSFIRTI
jgi:hypothetical protein